MVKVGKDQTVVHKISKKTNKHISKNAELFFESRDESLCYFPFLSHAHLWM